MVDEGFKNEFLSARFCKIEIYLRIQQMISVLHFFFCLMKNVFKF